MLALSAKQLILTVVRTAEDIQVISNNKYCVLLLAGLAMTFVLRIINQNDEGHAAVQPQ